MSCISIASLNVNGMKRDSRRLGISRTLLNLKLDIIGIQETGSPDNVNSNEKWQATFHCPTFWSKYCALVVHNRLISHISSEPLLDGRVLLSQLKLLDFSFYVTVIYAPVAAGQKNKFFSQLSSIEWPENNIFLGDFNCYSNPLVDHYPSSSTPKPGSIEFMNFLTMVNLIDISSPHISSLNNMTRITSKPRSGGGISGSRIDHIFVPNQLLNQFSPIFTMPTEFSDHRIIVTKWQPDIIIPNSHTRIRPIFALNPQLSEDILQHVYPLIAHPRNKDTPSIPEIWSTVKLKITSRASLKAKERSAAFLCAYKKAIARLKHLEANSPLIPNPRWEVQYIDAKCKFDRLQRSKMKKAESASLNKHLNESETMSPYFLRNMSTKNSFKTISELKGNNDEILSSSDEISLAVSSFYTNLYSLNPVSQADGVKLHNECGLPDVPEDFWCKVVDPILIEEVEAVVKRYPRRKASGPDGIPHELYFSNSSLFVPVLTELFNFCLDHGVPIPGGNESHIVLLFKKDCERDLRNWRPISLANTDYKVLTKVLNNRIASKTEKVLSVNQYGFIPGRSIWDNIFQVNNMLMSRSIHTKGYALFLDMEKAYDRVNLDFLYSTLIRYGLPSKFIQWLKLLYTDLSSKVLLSLSSTQPIPIKQGLRQGDPMSPTLFNFVIDVFLRYLNKSLKGISVNNTCSIKALAFADDTVVMIGCPKDLTSFHQCVQLYQLASNALLNQSKTIAITVGKPSFMCPISTCPPSTPFRHLGVLFNSYGVDCKANESLLLSKIQKMITVWRSKKISLYGRCIGANVFVLSRLWYLAHIVPFSTNFFTQLTRFLQHWLWPSYKVAPASISSVYYSRYCGGMGLIEPKLQCDKMLAKFLLPTISPSLIDPDCSWNIQASINWTQSIGNAPHNKSALGSWLAKRPARGPNCLARYWKLCLTSFKQSQVQISEVTPTHPHRGFVSKTFSLSYQGKKIDSMPINLSPTINVQMPLNIYKSLSSNPPFDPFWRKIWFLSHSKVMPAFHRTTMWRTLSKTWRTAERCSRDYVKNKCPFCDDPFSDTYHRYFTCPFILPAWELVYNWLIPSIAHPPAFEDIFFLSSIPHMPDSLRSIIFHTTLYFIHTVYIRKVSSNIIVPISSFSDPIFSAIQAHVSRVWKSREARIGNRSNISLWKSRASTWLNVDQNLNEVHLILPSDNNLVL